MESKGKERYLKVNGTKVPVSEEVFRAVSRQINRTRYVAMLEDRCGQPNYRWCKGDCGTCRFQHEGNIRLWKDFQSDEAMFPEVAAQESAENLLLRKEMWSRAYHCADDTVKYGSRVLRMRIEENLTMKQIANKLGLQIPHIEYKLRRIYAALKKHPDIFF